MSSRMSMAIAGARPMSRIARCICASTSEFPDCSHSRQISATIVAHRIGLLHRNRPARHPLTKTATSLAPVATVGLPSPRDIVLRYAGTAKECQTRTFGNTHFALRASLAQLTLLQADHSRATPLVVMVLPPHRAIDVA
jgi:hypothetical protein